MRLLALETSGRSGSAALLVAGAGSTIELVEELAIGEGQRTAQALVPCVDSLLKRHGWKPRELDAIAVAAGPGSFTGLRVGVVTAKTLAYATGARLVGVNTLAAMADQIPPGRRGRRLWTILDAQREELFAACFGANGPEDPSDESATLAEVLPIETWLARLMPGDAVSGPPLVKLLGRLPAGVASISEGDWAPTAAGVGRLGARLLVSGAATDPMTLVPAYFRQSAAEEKAAKGR